MADLSTRRLVLISVAIATTVAIAALVVAWARSDGLSTSSTCDDVDPPGGKLRSVTPPAGEGATTVAGAADAARARGAFRPESADVFYCEDLADPYVLRVDQLLGELLLVFGTQTSSAQVPVWQSGELLRSEQVGDALPKPPAWSRPGGVWAPSVLEHDGQFVLYYTTTHAASGRQCISVATSNDPEGPYTDESRSPLICPLEARRCHRPESIRDRQWRRLPALEERRELL